MFFDTPFRQIGTIDRVHVRTTDGMIYFYAEGDRTPRPACATQPNWVLASEAAPGTKQQLALLMLAQSTGRTVFVWGTGTCTRWPDGEDVREIAVSN